MKNPTKPVVAPWKRAAIWVTLLLVLTGSYFGGGLHKELVTPPTNPVTYDVADSGGSVGINSLTGEYCLTDDLADQLSWSGVESCTARGARLAATFEGSAKQFLPAYRWNSSLALYSNHGWKDLPEKVMTVISNLTFALSGLAWGILLMVTEWVLTLDVLRVGGGAINRSAHAIAVTIIESGFIWLLAAVLLFGILRSVIRGAVTGTVRKLLAFGIPIMLLLGFSLGEPPEGAVAPKGSPVWIAEQGLMLTEDIGVALGTGAGQLGRLEPGVKGNYPQPSCAAYTQVLEETYMAKASSSGAGSKLLPRVSQLWQRTAATAWRLAQYGTALSSERMWCHQLEANSNQPINEQILLGNAAGYPNRALLGSSPTKSELLFPYGSAFLDGKQFEAATFFWGACMADTSGKAELGNLKVQQAWALTGDITDEHCANWFAGTLNLDHGKLQWNGLKEEFALQKLYGNRDSNALDPTTPDTTTSTAYFDDIPDVQQTLASMRGHKPLTAVTAGVLSLVTAALYMYALGIVVVGAGIAQLGFALLLVFLPLTLTLLAFDGVRSNNSPQTPGRRMLRMTLMFGASKIVLVAAVTALISTISIIEGFLGSDSLFLRLFAPLAALLMLKKLAQQIGIGNLFSPAGALGMATAAAFTGAGENHTGGKLNPRNWSSPDSYNQKIAKLDHKYAATDRYVDGERVRSWRHKAARGAAIATSNPFPLLWGETKQRLNTTKNRAGNNMSAGAVAANLGAMGVAAIADATNPEGAKNKTVRDSVKQAADFAANRETAPAAVANNLMLQEQQRRQQHLSGLPVETRDETETNYFNDRLDLLRVQSQALRDKDGNPLLTEAGEPIFQFAKVDEAGNITKILSPTEAGFRDGKVNPGVEMLLTPKTTYSYHEQAASVDLFKEQFDLDPDVAVAGSLTGLPPVLIPQLDDNNKVVLPDTGSIAQTAQLLSSSPALFLPPEELASIESLNLSESAQNQLFNQINLATGGGTTVGDVLSSVDIDISTAAGLATLEAALISRQAGRPNVLDQLSTTIGSQIHTLKAQAVSYDRKLATSNTGVNLRNQYVEKIQAHAQELNTPLTIATAQNALSTLREQQRSVQDQINMLIAEQKVQPGRAPKLQTKIDVLQERLTHLVPDPETINQVLAASSHTQSIELELDRIQKVDLAIQKQKPYDDIVVIVDAAEKLEKQLDTQYQTSYHDIQTQLNKNPVAAVESLLDTVTVLTPTTQGLLNKLGRITRYQHPFSTPQSTKANLPETAKTIPALP